MYIYDKMEKLVKKHNNNLLRKNEINKRNCNCRPNNTCPRDGKCLSSNIVYSAEVLIGNNQHADKYFGICETEFKIRLGNHKNLFKNRQKEKDADLSKYIWNLKDKSTSGYNSVTNSCNLCLSEKLVICNFRDKDRLINKRMDLVSKCLH